MNTRRVLITWCTLILFAVTGATVRAAGKDVDELVDAVKTGGEEPVAFALAALQDHALLVFDDGLHNTLEPWLFYRDLVTHPDFAKRARHIFIEVLPVNEQPHLDAYFATYAERPELAFPALQAATMEGWRYRSLIDFLSAVHAANAKLPAEKRLRVHAVSTPTWWKEIESPEDYAVSLRAMPAGRDYLMYALIEETLNGFDGSERGLFLTNTRHAYKALRNREGHLFWNAATFAHQRHPGQVLSVRFNAPFLNIEAIKTEGGAPATQQGLENKRISWARGGGGTWDAAFARLGHRPVAVPLTGTPFGAAPYVGNRMLSAAPGQTMADVYDVLIHLKPLEEWRAAAAHDALYTPAFREEIMRRYRAAYSDADLAKILERNQAKDLAAFVGKLAAPEEAHPLPQAQDLPSLP